MFQESYNTKLEFTCLSGLRCFLICMQDSAQPAELPGSIAQLVRASPGKLMVMGLSHTRGSQFFFEK